jgi:hypothetical protein
LRNFTSLVSSLFATKDPSPINHSSHEIDVGILYLPAGMARKPSKTTPLRCARWNAQHEYGWIIVISLRSIKSLQNTTTQSTLVFIFIASLVFLGSVDTSKIEDRLQKYTHKNHNNNLDQLQVWSRTYETGFTISGLYRQISKEFLRPSDSIWLGLMHNTRAPAPLLRLR